MFRIDDGHPRGFQDEEVSLSYHSSTQIHHAFDFLTALTTPRTRSRRHRDTIAILQPVILVRTPCLRPRTSSYIFYHISPSFDWGSNKPTATRKFKTLSLQSLLYNHSDMDILRRSRFVHGIYSASTEFAFRTQPLPLNDTRLTNKCRDYVIVGRVWQKQVNDFVTARWARMYACT